MPSREIAVLSLAWAALAEGATPADAALGLDVGAHLGSEWITYPLGIAAGWLLLSWVVGLDVRDVVQHSGEALIIGG